MAGNATNANCIIDIDERNYFLATSIDTNMGKTIFMYYEIDLMKDIVRYCIRQMDIVDHMKRILTETYYMM